ncbi:zinc finger BED domain-containing protein RICESLEEPER 1-like [Alnus glutinosa]|uniref:zinc finger BED domain-containing protein RICESLEEPER 1-like n=1 Tax=Alnus glutinosa TaxID=3517 RepID=UPI002D774F4E|nr:zinc finger BED domain-containing protein RICESLEEPER 1-like [Alnus glutinosa]
MPTIWNLTYLMLESVIHYRRAFAYLEMTDKNYTFCPNALEWEKVNDISSFLGCFYRATCAFSGTKYLTVNLYFPVVALIYVNLKQELVSEDGYRRLMASQMISKFEKYWSEFSLVLAIAVVLGPHYKLRLVKYFYTKNYGAESQECENVTKTLTKLFMEYSASTTSSSTVVQPQEDSDLEKDFLALDGVNADAQKTQLELYLDEPKYLDKNMTFYILSFWKGNEFRYPEVAAMARDILSIPISTIASESIFSIGGHVIDQYRSSLKPDIIEVDNEEVDVLTLDSISSCDIRSSFGK